MYISQGQIIDENCQHVDNLMTLGSFINLLFLFTNEIYSTVMKRQFLITNNLKLTITNINRVIDNVTDYYTALRFGYDLGKPFPDFQGLMKVALERCHRGEMPKTYLETFNCMDGDQLIKYASHFVHSCVDIDVNVAPIFPINTNRLEAGNILFVYRLNDEVLFRGTKASRTSIDDLLHSSYQVYLSSIIVLLIVISFLYMFVFIICSKIEKKLKFTLKLLLSSAKTAIQNSFVLSVLSGHFARSSVDSSMRDDAFYDNLVDNLPNVIIVTQNSKIISANKAANELFNDDKLVGQTISDLFSSFSPESEAKMKNLFDTTVKTAMVNVRNNNNTTDKQYLQITRLSHVNNDNISVFRITNNTQIYLYNKLILEERSKSDKLLSSILPSSLVPRVQSGETNISFSVPTCAVSFIDIVEFTPWCSSNSAQVVTGVLNDIFSNFDAIVKELQYMERIKCIGDCYMSYCGVFSDVPNALTFARNIVDFGLRAIDAIKNINETRETNLRVRVGIHIGGPVVAGVIGVGKPTFEIFGPSISFAQQMEHSGVPMRVHVSRAIYELIYGGNYKIEERGEIQIKQGKVVTYLVDKI
ncbi:Adenylate and Guanylate cyclase catalytic domain containing protein [Trichomonas vaginalis G3]|uniref:Adenylate and Guanylate cyclase catalytic domain containing protein n=1 Tax=Trichomonas vaginalis (strain ATCC PRA-98 / G3) TaxID=412133 RepID=A2G3A5_TRIV3|nr:Adenylate and Guanylate cyclase catalytic domain containing protein [Trichomonas vaginalis G3]EAX88358.1 Adenylate and Guanylate cyclase catalytic domain containing protein [Trichomonas vaginalis G3]|eukprot:XP_001300182.1 Adenylate and Guanylate cyclase catalytic domain containing protein [Trichomonas vaginalis G3]